MVRTIRVFLYKFGWFRYWDLKKVEDCSVQAGFRQDNPKKSSWFLNKLVFK